MSLILDGTAGVNGPATKVIVEPEKQDFLPKLAALEGK